MNSGQWKTVSKNCLRHGFVLLPRFEGGEIFTYILFQHGLRHTSQLQWLSKAMHIS